MQLGGLSKLHRQYQIVTLARTQYAEDGAETDASIKIKVFALPLGHQRAYERIVPMPQPPKKTTQNKVTGTSVEKIIDDPAYLDAMDVFDDRRQAYTLWLALSPDTNVKFTNTPETPEGLDGINAELVNVGLTDGDKFQIISAAMKASGMTEELLERAKASF